MSEFNKQARNRVRRIPERGRYDRETVYQIVDEALICHVGFIQDDQPFVIPTIHARDGDRLYMHGAPASRMLKTIERGRPICVTVTLLDALVLARSVFHHSMNYRSAVLFGRGRLVEDIDEKMAGLRTVTEHIMPGRWDEARLPTKKELDGTTLVAMEIEDASAKVRSGPPVDDEADYDLPVWAGVLPMQQAFLDPLDDPRLSGGLTPPAYLDNYWRKGLKEDV